MFQVFRFRGLRLRRRYECDVFPVFPCVLVRRVGLLSVRPFFCLFRAGHYSILSVIATSLLFLFFFLTSSLGRCITYAYSTFLHFIHSIRSDALNLAPSLSFLSKLSYYGILSVLKLFFSPSFPPLTFTLLLVLSWSIGYYCQYKITLLASCILSVLALFTRSLHVDISIPLFHSSLCIESLLVLIPPLLFCIFFGVVHK